MLLKYYLNHKVNPDILPHIRPGMTRSHGYKVHQVSSYRMFPYIENHKYLRNTLKYNNT